MTDTAARRHFDSSDELCAYVRDQWGEVVLLSFSCGKDSIVAWLQMRRYFTRIVPYYLYEIPRLPLVEEALAYYEDYFQTPILRMPHPSLFRKLRNLVFQPPERCALIEAADLPNVTYAMIEAEVRRSSGLPDAYTGVGTRTADSPIRLASVRKHGSLNPKRRSFLPVYDWRIARVVEELKAARIRLPADYQLFGRSFDGIDYRFLKPLKDNRPEDYARILAWFPLAELEVKRREYAEARP
jgi:hypothetical protein